MSSYFTLEVGRGHLVNFPALAEDEGEGITQADLTRAELSAFNEINSELALFYRVADWVATTPAIIATVAELLGAAYAWSMCYAKDAVPMDQQPEGLRQYAREILTDIKRGRKQIVLSTGAIQPKEVTVSTSDLRS